MSASGADNVVPTAEEANVVDEAPVPATDKAFQQPTSADLVMAVPLNGDEGDPVLVVPLNGEEGDGYQAEKLSNRSFNASDFKSAVRELQTTPGGLRALAVFEEALRLSQRHARPDLQQSAPGRAALSILKPCKHDHEDKTSSTRAMLVKARGTKEGLQAVTEFRRKVAAEYAVDILINHWLASESGKKAFQQVMDALQAPGLADSVRRFVDHFQQSMEELLQSKYMQQLIAESGGDAVKLTASIQTMLRDLSAAIGGIAVLVEHDIVTIQTSISKLTACDKSGLNITKLLSAADGAPLNMLTAVQVTRLQTDAKQIETAAAGLSATKAEAAIAKAVDKVAAEGGEAIGMDAADVKGWRDVAAHVERAVDVKGLSYGTVAVDKSKVAIIDLTDRVAQSAVNRALVDEEQVALLKADIGDKVAAWVEKVVPILVQAYTVALSLIKTGTIPPISLQTQTAAGPVQVDVAKLSFGKVTGPTPPVHILLSGLSASARTGEIEARWKDIEWKVKQLSFPHISARGKLNIHVVLKSMAVPVSIAVVNNTPQLSIRESIVRIHKLHIKFRKSLLSPLLNLVSMGRIVNLRGIVEKVVNVKVREQLTAQLDKMQKEQALGPMTVNLAADERTYSVVTHGKR